MTGHVHASRDVDWCNQEGDRTPPVTDFTVDYLVTDIVDNRYPSAPVSPADTPRSEASGETPAQNVATPARSTTPVSMPAATGTRANQAPSFVSPPHGCSENLDIDHDDCPQRYRTLSNLLGDS
ncbi:hypothetical protein E2562_000456 [Oryza meyeriana var. granulata]|uniref:Uncharacterized protein n=1 Tax=Oryza meyeriana var. granulata TaxID=110450 RepID=A0A6G1CDA1_9ORYZ|nr:hypothetical protein E2562_000456 [Oryza meyeriana var. granulata]